MSILLPLLGRGQVVSVCAYLGVGWGGLRGAKSLVGSPCPLLPFLHYGGGRAISVVILSGVVPSVSLAAILSLCGDKGW